MSLDLTKQLAKELKLKTGQVKRTIDLLEDGNTIPFIARYRKERTGNLDEVELRELKDRFEYLTELEKRKESVIESIAKQDKLTKKLEKKIKGALKLQEVEDLYRPYKQKRKTRAAKAKERGLTPVTDFLLRQEEDITSLQELASEFLNPEQGIESREDVLAGARDIIAARVAHAPYSRKLAREVTFREGDLVTKAKVEEKTDYEVYYDYQKSINRMKPYQTLAINRGEEEDILQVKVITEDKKIISQLEERFIKRDFKFKSEIKEAIEDGYDRLLSPAIEREVRSKLTAAAEEHAIDIFAQNLNNLLLQSPLPNTKVIAIDPGFRTGAKVAVMDEVGDLLATTVIYPHNSQNLWQKAKDKLQELILEYNIEVACIGNGTACRETEELIAELISELEVKLEYVIVDEAGASIYSASEVAREEFPNLDVAMRGAVSIGRRLQDPLAELVKIAPKHLGIGMYQHDLSSSDLNKSLQTVVESVVNYVGVDLNTASKSLLEYVAGLSSLVAEKIIDYRSQSGKFKGRQEVKDVYGIGPKTFTQAAGFLRIRDGVNPLDNTPIHPESYDLAKELLNKIGHQITSLKQEEEIKDLRAELKDLNIKRLAQELDAGYHTLKDIKEALLKPGRDPRSDLPKPIFREDILKIDDLKVGQVVYGTVKNVVDFGAFVDIGVKEDGLVHISELSAKYVEDPLDFVAIGDIIKVKILKIDKQRKRIALSKDF
ncbi:MAG: Tex family protein [Halanaerobacter sp.]